MTSRSVEKCNK